ncbi:nucleotide exchange factor GrpE [Bacillus luteolus]|uniref:Protein GrpE n=1 Tax=Litchfieldia luteola TaxID=682179 RepID=A0ABR9QHS4_9BACI|nr:nucleotide exchange factor GrpE [Cytobacillus luteolus]MBP1942821.1 molecular chaperone GrpE [Cytobacillus luteolus]
MANENTIKEEVTNQEEMNTTQDTTMESTETSNETIVNNEEQDELTKANEKIADLEQKVQEYENKLYRVQADFENYKRRVRLDQEAAQKYRAQSLISDMLSSIDNFERAMKIDAEDEKTKTLLQGMDMVYRGLIEALKNEGVEIIDAVGQQFDPQLHQAVMQVEDSEYESGVVIEQFQKGYKLKDRVIRPSMVKVNQ